MNTEWTDGQIAALKRLGVEPQHVRSALDRIRPKSRITSPEIRKPMAGGGDVTGSDTTPNSPATVNINVGQPQGSAQNYGLPLPDRTQEMQAQDLAMTMGNVPAGQRLPMARQQVSSRVMVGNTPVPSGPANAIPGEGRLEPEGSEAMAGVRLPPPGPAKPIDPSQAVFAPASTTVPARQIAGQFANTMGQDVSRPPNIDPTAAMRAQEQFGSAQAQQATAVGGAMNAAKNDLQAFDLGWQKDVGDWQAKMRLATEHAAQNPVKDWSTGQKITAAIAVALGGIGGALSHTGQNTALQVINTAIDREIGLRKNEVDQLHGQFGDWNIAQGAMRSALTNEVAMQVDAVKNSTSNPVYKAQADAVSKQLQIQAQQTNNTNQIEWEKIRTERLNRYAMLMLQYGQRVVPDGDQMHIAPSDGEAATARQFMGARKTINETSDALLRLAREGRAMPGTQRDALAQQLTAELQETMRSALGEGSFKSGEFSFFKNIIENPANLWTVNQTALMQKVKGLKVFVDRKKDSLFSSWGQGGATMPAASIGSFRAVGAK